MYRHIFGSIGISIQAAFTVYIYTVKAACIDIAWDLLQEIRKYFDTSVCRYV